MLTVVGLGEAVRHDGMGMQAVDGRRSRRVGAAGVEVQMERRFGVGSRTRIRRAATDFREPGSQRLGLDPDLDLMDASVWCCCSQPRVCSGLQRVSRGPWRWAWGTGMCHTRQVEGAKTESPSQNRAHSLANMSFVVGEMGMMATGSCVLSGCGSAGEDVGCAE